MENRKIIEQLLFKNNLYAVLTAMRIIFFCIFSKKV